MPLTRADAAAFFDAYSEALLSRDPARIASHWATPGLVLSDGGAMPIAARTEVEQFFGAALGQYDGLVGARPRIGLAEPLSDTIILCRIDWDHLDPDGQVVGEETGTYILRRDGGDVAIQAYIPGPTTRSE